jgi:hypothetical protein
MPRIPWPLVLLSCANGRVDPTDDMDSSTPPVDTGVDHGGIMLDSGVTDSGAADSGVDAFDAGCSKSDAGLGGIGIPMGTTATASSSWQTSTPDKAIDGDLGTGWNAGGYSGSLTITFPQAQVMNGVRLATAASPASSETWTIYGIQNSTPTMIGSATMTAPNGIAVLSPINVMVGSYDAIRIDVAAQSSWASIVEVSVLTPNCP